MDAKSSKSKEKRQRKDGLGWPRRWLYLASVALLCNNELVRTDSLINFTCGLLGTMVVNGTLTFARSRPFNAGIFTLPRNSSVLRQKLALRCGAVSVFSFLALLSTMGQSPVPIANAR